MVILDDRELMRPRRVNEAIEWASSELNRIAALPRGRSLIRLNEDRTVKRLIEEYLPLTDYCVCKFAGQEVQIRLTRHVKPGVDAYVQKSDGTIIEAIQITRASFNYQDLLRMEILEEEGVAPAIGKVKLTKRNGHRHKQAGRACRKPQGLIDNAVEESVEAIHRKTTKNHKDVNVLLVYYELHGPSSNDAISEISQKVREKLGCIKACFQNIYLVESRGTVQEITM